MVTDDFDVVIDRRSRGDGVDELEQIFRGIGLFVELHGDEFVMDGLDVDRHVALGELHHRAEDGFVAFVDVAERIDGQRADADGKGVGIDEHRAQNGALRLNVRRENEFLRHLTSPR